VAHPAVAEVAKLGVLTRAKARSLQLGRSRGFENPLPRTASPGLAQFDLDPGLSNSEFFRGL
jgi:hypothetical protein